MKAGRTLDVLIAKRVMGWEPRGPHPIHGSLVFATGHADTLAPYFSVEIEAAWRVVDVLRQKFRRVEIHVLSDCACCMIEGGASEVDEHYVATEVAKTAPLAICLAALKAVDVEVER